MKGKIFRLFFLIMLCTHIPQVVAQARDQKIMDPEPPEPIEVFDSYDTTIPQFSGAYALVIGEGKYDHLPSLLFVKDDAKAIKDLFTQQGFHVETIEDADSDTLKNGIRNFLEKYGVKEDTRVIVYYAGHGTTVNSMGYIIPIDSPLPFQKGFQEKAIPMEQFHKWATDTRYKSRHILFIFDSCFAGTVFRSNSMRGPNPPAAINRLLRLPVRLFITSGTATEAVPDYSVFRRYLEEALRYGIQNENEYITGNALGEFLYMKVSNASNGKQNPQFGPLIGSDPNVTGDFIFKVKPQQIPETVTVTFNSNGGSPIPHQKIPYGDTLSLPIPTRENYIFDRWYDSPEFISPYNPTPVTWDRTLYAKWNPIPSPWWLGFSGGTSIPSSGGIFVPVGILTPNAAFFTSKNTFITFGIDVGLGTGDPDIDYFSIYPFAHYAWILPFNGWDLYAGLGLGYLIARTSSPKIDYNVWENALVMEAVGGINFTIGRVHIITPSLTYRWNTQENRFFNKLSINYSYRIK